MPLPPGDIPPLPAGYYFGTGPWYNAPGGDPYPYPRQNAGIAAQFVGGGSDGNGQIFTLRSGASPHRGVLFPTEPSGPG